MNRTIYRGVLIEQTATGYRIPAWDFKFDTLQEAKDDIDQHYKDME